MQDWVVDVVAELGVVGIALLMFAENLFPPLPSEVIMPLAGYLSSQGQLSFWPAVAAGTAGSLAGAVFWYWIGLRIAPQRLRALVASRGVWLALEPEDVDRTVAWFRGHGRYSVLLGRLVPLVRTLISVPAGFSRLPFGRFLLLSTAGTLVWTGALAYVGLILGQGFAEVDRYIGPVSWAVVAVSAVTYVYRVIRIRQRQRIARTRPNAHPEAREGS